MILGVGINYEHFLGAFDFKGWYAGSLLSVPLLLPYFRLNRQLLFLTLALAIPSAMSIAEGLYVSSKGLFTFLLFLFLVLYSRALLRAIGHEACIKLYAQLGLVHALIIILNEFLYVITPEVSFSIFGATEPVSILTRANGLFLEPSEAAFYLVPPLTYYFLKGKRGSFALAFVAMMVTFSSLTYIALALAILLAMYFRRVNLASLLLLAMLAVSIVTAAVISPQIADRMDTIFDFLGESDIDFESYNSSIATLIMNALVAKDSFIDSHFIGVGFGNFEYAFNHYAEAYFPPTYSGEGLFWNRNTGGSILIRTTAELGAIGIVILVYVLWRLFAIYRAIRERSIWGAETTVGERCYVVSAIVIFVICILRKDSLTNVHLFILLFGALTLSMAPSTESRRREPSCLANPG